MNTIHLLVLWNLQQVGDMVIELEVLLSWFGMCERLRFEPECNVKLYNLCMVKYNPTYS